MTVAITDAEQPVLTAIYNVLTADSTITSNTTGVFTQVPKGQTVPFIVIGSVTTVDYSTMAIGGQVLTLNVHIWDQNYSSSLIQTLKAAVINDLHDKTLTLTNGLTNVNTRYVNSQIIKDPDGLSQQMVIRFRIVTQNT